MTEEWVPFLEATERACRRLFLTDFNAKPLLRAACDTERIRSRGSYEEAGRIVISGTADLSQDPTVVKVGGYFYAKETYPAEIELTSLNAWIASMDRGAWHTAVSPDPAGNELASSRYRVPLDAQSIAENSSGSPSPKKSSSQRETIDRAIKELWGGHPPQGLTVERRDERIRQFAQANGLSVPSPRTIRRHLQ